MFKKEFYKMRLIPDECGLTVWTDLFLSIHETPCFYICIQESAKGFFNPTLMKDETPIKYAKRKGLKTFRIHKENSRIAFDNKDDAFKKLMFLKERQVMHLERELEFNKSFIKKAKGKKFDEFSDQHLNWPPGAIGVPSKVIDDTQELVRSHLAFE